MIMLNEWYSNDHHFKAPSRCIRIFLNLQLFLSGYAPIHTHSGNSATNTDIFESALQTGQKTLNESDNMWIANPDIFKSDDVAKLCQSLTEQ